MHVNVQVVCIIGGQLEFFMMKECHKDNEIGAASKLLVGRLLGIAGRKGKGDQAIIFATIDSFVKSR
jgi:hypothetical protein